MSRQVQSLSDQLRRLSSG
ncbi:hypothetical protein LD869_24765 [Salmonella enterica]|nr:hypothetical protein [Salmonella enterica]